MIKNEFIIAHFDSAFPTEERVAEFFTAAFSEIENAEWQQNLSAQFNEPEFWTSLELDRNDEDGTLLTRIVVDAVRKRNYPSSFVFSELKVDSFFQQLENGNLKGYAAHISLENWCFTSISIESEDARERKEFIRLVDRFLDFTKGIILYPEVMSHEEFKSFYSLKVDKVIEDVEPIDEE